MASNDPDFPGPSGDPQPGDLIEIFRPAYQHWALYLGDGYIINLTPVGQWDAPVQTQHCKNPNLAIVTDPSIAGVSFTLSDSSAMLPLVSLLKPHHL